MNSTTPVDWTAVAGTATALALVLGVITFYWQHRSQLRRDAHDQSKFALDSSLTAYRAALAQLEDGNNDRVTWITAARIIQRANELSLLVSDASHRAVLEVDKELFRSRAATILGYDNSALGAWFFRGWEGPTEENTGDAVGRAVDRFTRRRGRLELSSASIATVYELASFPTNYEEPLRQERLEKHIGIEMRAGFPGLYEYLSSGPNQRGRTES